MSNLQVEHFQTLFIIMKHVLIVLLKIKADKSNKLHDLFYGIFHCILVYEHSRVNNIMTKHKTYILYLKCQKKYMYIWHSYSWFVHSLFLLGVWNEWSALSDCIIEVCTRHDNYIYIYASPTFSVLYLYGAFRRLAVYCLYSCPSSSCVFLFLLFNNRICHTERSLFLNIFKIYSFLL